MGSRETGLASSAFVCAVLLAAFPRTCWAEALPGRFEAIGGAHVLVLGKDRCEADGDVVGCSGPWLFAGFEAAAHAQVIPWLALGVRAAWSKDWGAGDGFDSGGFAISRGTTLWRGSLEARFDPPLWPRAIWLAAELGAVLAVATADIEGSRGNTIESSSTSTAGFLAGAAVGWDFSLYEGLILGFDARVQLLTVEKLGTPPSVTGRTELGSFPYASLGVHAGYRW